MSILVSFPLAARMQTSRWLRRQKSHKNGSPATRTAGSLNHCMEEEDHSSRRDSLLELLHDPEIKSYCV